MSYEIPYDGHSKMEFFLFVLFILSMSVTGMLNIFDSLSNDNGINIFEADDL